MATEKELTPAPIDADRMQFRVGTSLVEQFASGHDFPAVFCELVQNEYDAGGARLEVRFAEDGLHVSGTGRTIDAKGWARLSVVLGTGRVAGTEESVQPKINGIGSKNFGLRSLFIIGDTIVVRSGGRCNALSIAHGTYPEPQPDPEGLGVSGVRLFVPFREDVSGILPTFDAQRELTALDALATGFGPTLTKLAHPGARSGLTRVDVQSERHDRRMSWRQKAETVPCKVRGVKAVRRTIRLTDSSGGNRSMFELEFSRAIAIPDRFDGKNFPRYFARPSGRVAVAVSLRLRRNRIDLEEPGIWFYPIGVTGQTTGTCVSVSAPFDMDNDRTSPLPVGVSDWNAWLAEKAAALVVDLLAADWWPRFGADAHIAAWPSGGSSDPHFAETLKALLTSRSIWPTRASTKSSRFSLASEMVVADPPAVDGVLPEKRYAPLEALTSTLFTEALRAAGAKPFGINSLVRLRCAGKDADGLATQVETNAANFYFSNFASLLTEPKTQLELALALDAVERRLSNSNRKDLRTTESTLSASGDLRPAEQLQRVPPEIAQACPLPLASRLHPILVDSKVMRRVTGEYRPEAWALEVGERAQRDAATDEELQAVYDLLLARRGKLARRVLATLRRAPIVRDHNGAWAAPRDLVLRRTDGARDFLPVLRYPERVIEQDPQMVRALRIRHRLRTEDLLEYANLVESEPERASAFQRTLTKHRRLLTPRARRELANIDFLPSSEGGVAAPSSLYVDTPHLRKCVGPNTAFAVTELSVSLLGQLGCHKKPHSSDILVYLEHLVDDDQPLDAPDVVYPELVHALQRERMPIRSLADRRILWTDCGWVAPENVVLAASSARLPQGSVPRPTARGQEVLEAYERLGAHRIPKAHHWRAFLIWASESFGNDRSLPRAIRTSVRHAYAQLGEEPGDFDPAARILLDRSGRLHPYEAAMRGHFAVDNDPPLAEALVKERAAVALADVSNPRSYRFYGALGVKSLRDLRSFVTCEASEEQPAPSRVRVEEILRRTADPALSSALAAFIAARFHQSPGLRPPRASDVSRRLRSFRQLTFVQEIHEVYNVTGYTVRVSVPAHDAGDRIVLAGVRTMAEALGVLADTVAPSLPGATDFEWADVLFRLLSCDSAEEMSGYLRSRGVSWRPPLRGTDAEGESEIDEVADAVVEALRAATSGDPSRPRKSASTPTRPPPVDTPQNPPLPPLQDVHPIVLDATETVVLSPRGSGGSGGGWAGGAISRNEERDREIGERGEAVVYEMERERLQKAGLDTDLVVWTSRDDPTADHDIRSVGDDGEPIWIEVKSTTGWDGKFRWSRAEFHLARQERTRYILYRVYGVDTLHPVVKRFPDPMALLIRERLQLDISQLQAEVEGAAPP